MELIAPPDYVSIPNYVWIENFPSRTWQRGRRQAHGGAPPPVHGDAREELLSPGHGRGRRRAHGGSSSSRQWRAARGGTKRQGEREQSDAHSGEAGDERAVRRRRGWCGAATKSGSLTA